MTGVVDTSLPPPPTGPPTPPRPPWLPVVRAVLIGAYVGALLAWWGTNGVPLDREQILLWLAGALVTLSIGSPAGGPWRVLRDWLPVALVLVLYDLTRGAADEYLGITAHVRPQLVADQWLGLGEVPTVRLQQVLYDKAALARGERAWWWVILTLTYVSHFFVSFVVAAVFWLRDRPRYWAFVRRFVTLSFTAAVTFLLFPAVPPWLAAEQGELDPVLRTAAWGWGVLNLDIAQDVLELGQRTANLVAAIPSLHAGYSLLVSWMLWPSFGRVGRSVLVAYPLLMAFTLVASGEHYLVDVFIGWLYAAVVCLAWDRLERRPFWRRDPRPGGEGEPAGAEPGARPPGAIRAGR